MITRHNKYIDYGSKEYYENAVNEARLTCDTLAAGMATIFAERNRYTLAELGDIAHIFVTKVNELEDNLEYMNEHFENGGDDESQQ